nr:hypothetical protein [bacterium]
PVRLNKYWMFFQDETDRMIIFNSMMGMAVAIDDPDMEQQIAYLNQGNTIAYRQKHPVMRALYEKLIVVDDAYDEDIHIKLSYDKRITNAAMQF